MRRENIIFCLELRACTNRWTKTRFEYAIVVVVVSATVTVNGGFVCLDYDIEDIGSARTNQRIEEELKFSATKLAENRILVREVIDVIAVTSKSEDQTLFISKNTEVETNQIAPKKKARSIRKKKIVNVNNQQSMIF